jgi:hypothetical protein
MCVRKAHKKLAVDAHRAKLQKYRNSPLYLNEIPIAMGNDP